MVWMYYLTAESVWARSGSNESFGSPPSSTYKSSFGYLYKWRSSRGDP